MRALLCHCRQHLEAENDAALREVVREHLILMHPNLEPTRDQVEEIVATRAYDLEYKEVYPNVDFAFEPR
jgi:citrate synthase